MDNFLLLLVVGTSIWVYFDAKNIGVKKGLVTGLADLNPGGWLIVCLLLWFIAFPVYLIKRGDLKKAAGLTTGGANEYSGMVFCRGCGKQIHSSATQCPHCGAPQ